MREDDDAREEAQEEIQEEIWGLRIPDATIAERILQKTPWWAISVAFHCTLLLVLWVVKFGMVSGDAVEFEPRRITIEQPPEKDEIISEKRKIEPVDVPIVKDKKKMKGPIVEVHIPKSDHVETPNDSDMQMAKGHEMCLELNEFDIPFAQLTSPIGVGPGSRKPGGSYGWRTPGGRDARMKDIGGWDGPMGSAIQAALRWLARHQSADGSWRPDTWSRECPAGDSCVGRGGGGQNDVGGDYPGAITGFALLAFLGAGHTHLHGDFKVTVRKALDYLMKIQKENGKFEAGQGTRMYSHGIATLAAVEAYGMTGSARYKGMAQSAVDYIVYCQNPLGGWNYTSPSARNDTSVTGWQFMALKSAKISKLHVPNETIDRVRRWLEIAGGGNYSGRFCYTVNGTDPTKEYNINAGSIRMRAVGCLGYYFFGMADANDEMMKTSGEVFLQNLPAWNADGKGVDLYYWYYATLVNIQTGKKYWKAWDTALQKALLDTQQTKGHADGSWAPVDKYSNRWSRPGITALSALCLEARIRYVY